MPVLPENHKRVIIEAAFLHFSHWHTNTASDGSVCTLSQVFLVCEAKSYLLLGLENLSFKLSYWYLGKIYPKNWDSLGSVYKSSCLCDDCQFCQCNICLGPKTVRKEKLQANIGTGKMALVKWSAAESWRPVLGPHRKVICRTPR